MATEGVKAFLAPMHSSIGIVVANLQRDHGLNDDALMLRALRVLGRRGILKANTPKDLALLPGYVHSAYYVMGASRLAAMSLEEGPLGDLRVPGDI
jgi:hypothetical protein